MTVINLNKHTIKNKENLSYTWMTFEKQSWNGQGTTVNGDAEYLNIWNENFKDFSGNILEIGAGTGFLANHILETNKNINYTILDIESHFASLKNKLSSYDIDYISSQNYKNIFKQDWDLLIAIHCLSETPQHYYTDIYENLSIKKFFVIDYGIEKDDPAYEPTLQKWFNGFDNGKKIINLNLAGAAKRNGIPVYIGK
mgnify:CR=1 FL=1|tara:strand:+ start:1748 stop:2341 length:594 start_codon:yes stop_codon:yes gene_type:complete